jgi:hypothetical protein
MASSSKGRAGDKLANQRFELLKWAFLFWVGQFFAVPV